MACSNDPIAISPNGDFCIKIKDLGLSFNTNMGVEGLSSVGQILSNQSCVEYLGLRNCNLSSDQLQAFKSSLGNTEIKKMWLYGNRNMGVEGLSSVGQILSNQSCVELLELELWCSSFTQAQSQYEIDHLYLDEDRTANHEDIVAVANLLPNVTKKLSLHGWRIADEDKEILQNKLDEIGSEELEIQFFSSTLKSQRKSADATTNFFSKQLPTTTSKAEFGSPYANSFENTGENVATLQEVGSPRSELLLSEEEAEQSDEEVMEELAKPTQHTLPQIENISSQRSGSDILLTWNAVSDRNVLYNIEIFCDDEKLGETHTTEVPQYRMKSSKLGKKYRFQVWAKDELGNSGIKTQSKNVIKFVNIEVAGGSMRLNECKVTFPSGTFNKRTKVWLSVGIDNSICPKEYIGITPFFDISADSKFYKDAIVQIKSWCVGLEKDKIDILHFSSKTDWDIINPDRITKDNSIEFRCRKFSLFTVAIKWLKWLIGKQQVIVDNCLYMSNKNDFHFTFYGQCETAETRIRSHFRELGARLAPIWFNPIPLETGDRLRLELQIDRGQENLQFNMPHGRFDCDNTFLTSQRHKLTFHLLPNLQEYPERLIVCRVLKNDVLHEMQDFHFPLAPLEGGGPPPVNFAGANIGNVNLPGNHNNQQMGQNEQRQPGAVGGNQAREPQLNEPLQHESDNDSDDLC
uniref:uncharacterized protein LOC120334452 n=1 Tax=Styela clava TaxID=7725 RepID=UPI00193A266A|nr:uncharacterized protein LOC120334452 [Styela clava]